MGKEDLPEMPNQEKFLWDQYHRTTKLVVGVASFIRTKGTGDYGRSLKKLEDSLGKTSLDLNDGRLPVNDAVTEINSIYERIRSLAKNAGVSIETITEGELIAEYERSARALGRIFNDMTEPDDPSKIH